MSSNDIENVTYLLLIQPSELSSLSDVFMTGENLQHGTHQCILLAKAFHTCCD